MKLYLLLSLISITSIFCKKENPTQPQASATTTYYIVRHAEKDAAVPSNDPPLSTAGDDRAKALRDSLANKGITAIFATATTRAQSTAQYTSQQSTVSIQTYGPFPDAAFINQLKKLEGNVLIVGHSNAVDDIVNGLSGQTQINDLSDSEYGDLFVVTLTGTQVTYSKKHFGN